MAAPDKLERRKPGETRVSIIVPHRNHVDAALLCLASLKAQDYPADHVEIILVDNGSTADLAPIAVAHPDVLILHEAEPGPGLARNLGARAATGEILAFIDADCLAHPGWLAAAIRGVIETGGPVGGDVRIATARSGRHGPIEAFEAVFGFRQQMYIERQHFSVTANLAMPVDAFRAVGSFGGIAIAEDNDWGVRAWRAGRAVTYRSEMIVFHPARPTLGALRTKWRRQIAHQLAAHRAGRRPAWRWLAQAGIVLASALPHLPVLLSSPRVPRVMDRLRAVPVLVSIRAWRAAEMMRQLNAKGGSAAAQVWNT